MKRWIIILMMLVLSLSLLAGCGKKRIVHCDSCGKEVVIPDDSKMTEDWIVLCEDCAKEVDTVTEPRP